MRLKVWRHAEDLRRISLEAVGAVYGVTGIRSLGIMPQANWNFRDFEEGSIIVKR